MNQDKIVLKAHNMEYLSRLDEDMFFEWLGKLSCVLSVEGVGDELQITVSTSRVEDACLRELIALFSRYQIGLKQLAVFQDDKRRKWFSDSQKYWFSEVFG